MSLSDLTRAIAERRLSSQIQGDRRLFQRQTLNGISVRQRVAFTGVIGIAATLGDRNAETGQREMLSGDGSIRSAQAIGFGSYPVGDAIPSAVIDGSGGWIDWE